MEHNTPKYTFLLPAYKPEYLYSSIQSILQQSFSDFRLIISDDYSPYDLYKIVKQFEYDDRVKYCRNSRNIGAKDLVDHWNYLVAKCETDYLIMSSDDDIYDVDFLKEIDDYVCRYPEVCVFRPLTRHINCNGGVIQTEKYTGKEHVSVNQYVELWGNNQLKSGVSFFVFRREGFKNIGGFVYFPYAWFSDDATAFLLAKENGICIIRSVLFSFRISTTSITGQGGNTLGKLKSGVHFANLIKRDMNLDQVSEELAINRIRKLSRWALLSAGFFPFMVGIIYLLIWGQNMHSSWWILHIVNARRAEKKR